MEKLVSGKVVKGEAVGRKIGFPTANLQLVKKPKVKPGVYASLVTLNKQNYLGLAYFGPRYIFGEPQNSFEVFIFDFNLDIYGQNLSVKLLKFLRPPQMVNDLMELKQLLMADVKRLDNDIILVDSRDKIIGIGDKIESHQGQGRRHRAISVQLFNRKGELLIQQRSRYKRLFPLVWANTVCTDVRPYENYMMAATRRLREEFGLAAELRPEFKFNYQAKWGAGGENEIDQVFFGAVRAKPKPDPKEIAAWKFISLVEARKQLKNYAPWFQVILKKIKPSDIVNT